MHKWKHIVILFFLPSIALSQVLSSKGRFAIDFNKGCAPLIVNITSLDDFGEATRLYSYLEPHANEDAINDTTFTYDTPGEYKIVQIIGLDGIGDKRDTLFLEVVEPLQPILEMTNCSNNEVFITSRDLYYDSLRIYFTSTDSITLIENETYVYQFPQSGTHSIILKGLFSNANEICPTYFEEIISLPSLSDPELMDAIIKETCRNEYGLYIHLKEIQTNSSYQIVLEQTDQTIVYEGTLDSTSILLRDVPFQIADYCVEIRLQDPCNESKLISNKICKSLNSLSLTPFESLYSSYTSSAIYVNLDEVSTGTFEIERKYKGGTFESRGIKSGSFHDPIGTSSRQYFYQISYRDECGEILYTSQTNPPLIEASEIDPNHYQVVLTPADNALEGEVSSSYSIGNEGIFSTSEISTTPIDIMLSSENGSSKQVMTVTSHYADDLHIDSNSILLQYELLVYVPSAFTPNNDGLNDTLKFFGPPSSNAVVKIYSKWGLVVYTSTDLSEGWDGKISGNKATSGTYLYEIVLTTQNGEKLRQRGTFVLLDK